MTAEEEIAQLKRELAAERVKSASFEASQKRPNSDFPFHWTRKKPIREYRLGVNVCYVLESSRDNQSTTYLKAHEWIRCVRSGRSKKLVEIKFLVRREQVGLLSNYEM